MGRPPAALVRLRAGAEPDPWRDLVRRHGLSAGEVPRSPRTRVLVVVVVIGWVTTVLGVLVSHVVPGEGVDVNWSTVAVGVAVGAWVVRRRRALRRAVELNDEPAVDQDG